MAPGAEDGTILRVLEADHRILGIVMRISFGITTSNNRWTPSATRCCGETQGCQVNPGRARPVPVARPGF
jgi:hypothetical protein